jgi:TolA-binding protein
MKKYPLLAVTCLIVLFSYAQQTYTYRDPQQKFNLAKEYFAKEQYNLAYPILKELQTSIRETDRLNNALMVQEIQYYTTVAALKQNEGRAFEDAQRYIAVEKNDARVQMMRFHLAEYHFRRQEFSEAVPLFEGVNVSNLSNREVADAKFHQGYSYFTLQQFARAKPLFNTIRQLKKDSNYVDANYYYGFIAFRDRNYDEALSSFRVVENHPNYESIVPYYIAQIYYVQGKEAEALAYAETKMKSGKSQYYDLEIKKLLGHGFFVQKQYAKAVPYLEEYIAGSKKVSREDLYELSYAYYSTKNLPKAIEGFKQLSGREDSLSQHAMYLLGDSYLRTAQKAPARNAFLFSASNNSNTAQREISRFIYAKLSYELGYQDEALRNLRSFLDDYPATVYKEEATDLLVRALTNTNNYREALTLLDSLKYPSASAKRLYPRILLGRATELINDGQLQEAETLLDKAFRDANNTEVLPLINFWKGELAYRSNRIDDALQYYHAYLNAGAPANGEANERSVKYNLGYAYYRKENYPVAQTFFEPLARNVSLSSDAVTQDAYVRTADAYYMNRNYAQARTMYDNVIRLSWAAEDYATFQKAMIAGINSATEKINALNTVIRKFPQSSLVMDANMEIANTYLANERFSEALPYLKNIINATGNNSLKPQAYLKSGIAYYNINRNDEAIAQYKKLLAEYPNAPEADEALDNLKTVYIEQGNAGGYAEAARQAGKPISVNAEDSLTFAAAEIQYQNNNANALPALESYLQRFPTGSYSTNAQYYRGEIYGTRKAWKEALTSYAVVAERAPNPFAERAVLQAARINFFELKDYAAAEQYYGQLKNITSGQEARLEAMRGLLRSQYQQQKWTEAMANAQELVAQKGSSSDDKALANMAIGKSAQIKGEYDVAIASFKNVIAVNKAAIGAEARYEIAASWFAVGRFPDAEKAAFEVINKSGSYEFWVTKAYILLGDVYFRQKDYFNAKATFQSVVENTLNMELKGEAQRKLDAVNAEESNSSKLTNQ